MYRADRCKFVRPLTSAVARILPLPVLLYHATYRLSCATVRGWFQHSKQSEPLPCSSTARIVNGAMLASPNSLVLLPLLCIQQRHDFRWCQAATNNGVEALSCSYMVYRASTSSLRLAVPNMRACSASIRPMLLKTRYIWKRVHFGCG